MTVFKMNDEKRKQGRCDEVTERLIGKSPVTRRSADHAEESEAGGVLKDGNGAYDNRWDYQCDWQPPQNNSRSLLFNMYRKPARRTWVPRNNFSNAER